MFRFGQNYIDRELGVIGVDHDRKQILMVLAGSASDEDWTDNKKIMFVPHWLCDRCMVHQGFYEKVTSMDAERAVLSRLVETHPDYQLVFVGHSLGGALVTLLSLEYIDSHPLVVAFAMPRIGNRQMARSMDASFHTSRICPTNFVDEKLNVGLVRVVNDDDIVPYLPPGYHHAGCVYTIRNHQLPHPPESLIRGELKGRLMRKVPPTLYWRWRHSHHMYFIDVSLCGWE